MCFSTEASFAAGVVLVAAGGVTLKNISSPSQFFLAAIPFLFAIQQIAEGFVWLHLYRNFGSESFFINTQKIFLTFAYLIWPIWIPLSLGIIEQIAWRRYVIYLLLCCGIVLSLVNLSYIVDQNMRVRMINHSLQYHVKMPSQCLIYPTIVLLPCFLSSLKNVKLFGILITIGFAVAAYFYEKTFVSVWCFFAAIVSLCVYKVMKDVQKNFLGESIEE